MFLYQPPQPSRTRKRNQGNTNTARTDEVFEQILSAALPANPKALNRVRELVQSSPDRGALAKELISDAGLALYFLTHARAVLNLDHLPEDPLSSLESMSDLQLRHLFDVSPSQISKHRISEAGPPQLLRLQHTFIASNSAASLSRQFFLSEGKAFSLVQLQQSALNLMAWSYPSQFHKALFNQRRFKASLHESLSSLVGVRPENLVNKLARKIGLPTSLMLDLQLAQRTSETELTVVPTTPSPITLAGLGDLLARANDVEHYPDALAQWSKIETQLEDRGIANPKDELHESIKSFVAELGAQNSLPYQAGLFPTQERTKPDSSQIQTELVRHNQYLRKVPESLRPLFERVYSLVQPNQLSVEALQILIEGLVPVLGVASGCLYLAKGEKLELNPTLNFGKIKRDRPSFHLHSSHPVPQSLFSTLPQQFDSGSGLFSVCGALPECHKQCVLLLDFEPAVYERLGDQFFSIFHAFSLTLVDVLGQRISA